jgi:predicted outer membrane repeat protein
MTRSGAARAGSLASAGVLMSAGLFGAYVGNPRIQRAYATSNAPCVRDALATDDTSLRLALDDSMITCIEIQGTFGLDSNLPPVREGDWVGSARQTDGLTLFGTGDDTIDGNGYLGPQVTLVGAPVSPAPNNAPATLNVSDLTLTDFENGNGAAIYVYLDGQTVDANVTLNNVTVSDSATTWAGAAVYVVSRNSDVYLSVTESEFTNNAAHLGGAIYAAGDDTALVSVSASTFIGNTAVGSGGAVYAKSVSGVSSVTVTDSSYFAQNQSGYGGGAVGSSGQVHVDGDTSDPVVFLDDTAGWGGAIYAKQGGSINGAVFEGNSAGIGGALYSYTTGLSISNSTFDGNTATTHSGGAITTNGDTVLNNVSVINNESADRGGGVFVDVGGHLQVENSFLGGNTAGGRGGAIFGTGRVSLEFTTVYDDTGVAGASEIWATDVDATMTVVGSSTTGDIWEVAGDIDDTASVSTSDDTAFDGLGSGNLTAGPGVLGFGPLDGDLPGTQGRTPEADSVLALAVGPSPLGFAPISNPLAPDITTDQLGVTRAAPFTIGARQYPWPTPPSPPAPAPATPAGPPREVTAVAGVQSAVVSWAAPSSSGSFPVTSYQVTSSPGGHGCLVSAPALTCTITGLTAGDSYTFVAKALTGAGWSPSSAPSNAVVPEGQPDTKAILITSSRDRIAPSIVRVDGTTTGLVGEQVTPHVRKPGQTGFTPGSNVRTVDANGRFTWQRKSGKKLYVYFTSSDVRSNRLVIGSA